MFYQRSMDNRHLETKQCRHGAYFVSLKTNHCGRSREIAAAIRQE